MSAEVFRQRVGRLIRSAREEANLKQSDLCARTDKAMTKSLLSRYECGHVLPGIERLEKMLVICGQAGVPPAIEAGYRQVSQESPCPLGQVFATESAKEFVAAWLEHRSIDGVAEALGLHRKQVNWYAARLRQKGIALPKVAHRKPITARPRENIDEIRAFLEAKLAEETPDILQLPDKKGAG
jgi:transcriptional regulator with XRE-family HTH domain